MNSATAEASEACTAALDEPIDEKSAAIVAAARQAFLAKGFDGASMDHIALIAGVSKRTVYTRFRSKEELFAGMVTETCQRILPFHIDADDERPLEEFLLEIADRLLRVTMEPDALALHRLITFEAGRNPELGHTFMENGPRRVFRMVRPYLESQIAKGRIRDVDPVEAMWRFAALVSEPLETKLLMGEGPEDLDAAIREQASNGVRDFLTLYGTGKA